MKITRIGFRRYLLILGLLLIVCIALVGAMEYTSQSAFCISCHEMKPAYEAWQSSTHNSVQCIKCHSNPGIAGLVETKLQALKEVYRHITKTYKQPITIDSDTAAFTDRCLRCHDIKGTGTAHNLTHFESNVNCADCHLGMVHNPEKNRKLPNSEVCKKCHAQS